MSLFKKASSPFLAAFLLATSLPVSCASPTTDTPQTSVNGSSQASLENTAALSGIVSIGRSSDGRFVPPTESLLITVVSLTIRSA